FRGNGLPFGISVLGRAFTDEGLLTVAERYLCGTTALPCPSGCVALAVVGAHLTGMPLNRELLACGARLLQATRPAPGYRLYHLAGTAPPKPGLVRDQSFEGPGIEVEVWAVPYDQFGRFVAAVPPPLGIGSATLASGEVVKCFICEPYAVSGATDI